MAIVDHAVSLTKKKGPKMNSPLHKFFSALIVLLVVLQYLTNGIFPVEAQLTEIQYVEWSPAGNKIAAGSFNNIWTYNSSLEILASTSIPTFLASLIWSPDGSKLATLSVESLEDTRWVLEIRDPDTLVVLSTTQEENIRISYPKAVWSPDGNKIAVNHGTAVKIISVSSGQITTTLSSPNFEASHLAWSPDSSKIATPNGRELIIWDANSGNILDDFSDGDFFSNFTWSPDGDLFAILRGALTTSDIVVWNYASFQIIAILSGDTDTISDLSWHMNKLASSSITGDIRIWDVTSNLILEEFSLSERINAISWSPDGTKLAYGGTTGINFLLIDETICTPTQTISAGDVAGLITAINTANANPDAAVIGLAAGMYTFTGINNNRNALPRITTDITICSTDGATLTRSPSAPQFRFFEVRSTGKLTLENLTLTSGSLGVDDDGGAIFNLGTLAVNQVTFSNNQAGVGGAIASEDGLVSVTDSTFTNNASTGDGGAIHSEADLLIENSIFTGNTADDAGAVNNDGGTLTVTNSTFTDNSADDGGAIYNDAGTLTLSGSTFTNNTGDAGGALDNLDGQAQIASSTFTGNSASDGGAIRNYGGTISLTVSRFTGNTATDDGGALNNSGGTLTITDTRLESNIATTRGGAMYSNSSGTMSAHNSCISGNSATAVYAASTGLQDFTGNWWGAANGPGGAGVRGYHQQQD